MRISDWSSDVCSSDLAPDELIAHGRSEEEVQQLIGCDWLVYQDIADLEAACASPGQRKHGFDSSCFPGEYVTGIEPGYFEGLSRIRSDAAQQNRRKAVCVRSERPTSELQSLMRI